MVGHPLIQGLTPSAGFTSPFHIRHWSSSPLPCLPFGSQKRVVFIRAMSSDTEQNPPPFPSEAKSALLAVLDVSRSIWKQALRPVSDFGFGRRSIWEGGVGLLLFSGMVLFLLSLAWLRAFQMRSKFRKYMAVFGFSEACGICTRAPVRIRGVTVGNVIRVDPSLISVEAVAEVDDDKIIIPRNSFVEVNQSGLLMETVIDITPKDPIPTPSLGPLDPECEKEGLIVCDRQKIKGYQGVSLDELVGIFTRIGREVEEIDVANSYSLAKRVAVVLEEAKPLLSKLKPCPKIFNHCCQRSVTLVCSGKLKF